ncbi:unnamed protein product [Agarophyton chilense]
MELRSRTIAKSDASSTATSEIAFEKTGAAFEKDAEARTTPRRSGSGRGRRRAPDSYPWYQIVAAWMVHLFTASGLLVNMFALLHAIFGQSDFNLFAKLNWLAIFIDAVDGTFARAVNIKKVIPTYDGAMLDNIIDFQTFSVLPALCIVVFELVQGKVAQYAAAVAILLASAYQFCQTIAKTPDAFVGFPSYWNIVVFYIYYLKPTTVVSMVLIFSCAVLSFIPVHFIYPTRTKEFHYVNHIGAYIWSGLMMVPTMQPESRYVKPALYASFVYVMYYFALSMALDVRRRKGQA